jgi:hypothetical protein
LRSDLFEFVGRKTIAAATSSSSVSSSSEVNFLDSIKPTESKGDLAELLDEISYKHNFEDVSDLPCQNGGSKEDFPIFTIVSPMVLGRVDVRLGTPG